MRKTLCHVALEYAGIEPTDNRIAILKCINRLPGPFTIRDVHEQSRLNGKNLSHATVTGTLLLFRNRNIIRLDKTSKSGSRGRPVTLYKLA